MGALFTEWGENTVRLTTASSNNFFSHFKNVSLDTGLCGLIKPKKKCFVMLMCIFSPFHVFPSIKKQTDLSWECAGNLNPLLSNNGLLVFIVSSVLMMQTSVFSILSNVTSDKSFRLLLPDNKSNSIPNFNVKEINVVWQSQHPKYNCILVMKFLY